MLLHGTFEKNSENEHEFPQAVSEKKMLDILARASRKNRSHKVMDLSREKAAWRAS